MKKYFTITTNRQTADQIKQQCSYDEKFGDRSYELGTIAHEQNYSVIQIIAKKETIDPADIFWLGYFSATRGK